jgi:excisionase family DNA binding protein
MMALPTSSHANGSHSRDAANAREAACDSLSLVMELTAEQLDAIAERVAARIAESSTAAAPTWLDTRGAADYIAGTVGRIHDLVQLRRLTPRRDGRRLLFRRDDLDAYLERSA